MDEGTKLTLDLIKTKRKPFFLIDLSMNIDTSKVKEWIIYNDLKTINIAGPRESNCPGIYQQSKEILSKVLQ